MRSFDCHYYRMREDGILLKNTNTACWAGLNGNKCWYIPEQKLEEGRIGYSYGNLINFDKDNEDYIFIDEWKENDQSMKNIRRLLNIIDKITYCKIIKFENNWYIKYKCIKNHYANLVLLNFIRNCWHIPPAFEYEQFFKDIFKDIRGKEPLTFLMKCLKDNVKKGEHYSYGSHSNVYLGIIPKPKERLFKYTGHTMYTFLTSK